MQPGHREAWEPERTSLRGFHNALGTSSWVKWQGQAPPTIDHKPQTLPSRVAEPERDTCRNSSPVLGLFAFKEPTRLRGICFLASNLTGWSVPLLRLLPPQPADLSPFGGKEHMKIVGLRFSPQPLQILQARNLFRTQSPDVRTPWEGRAGKRCPVTLGNGAVNYWNQK